jgi:glutaredoxin-like protein
VDVRSKEVFGGKSVIVFSLPGAFTPTCSSSHVPRYNQLVPQFKAKGIDEVICVSVNDAFVMNEWQRAQNADRVTFLPDGNGDFSDGMGLLVGKEDLGFGKRSWRYSMLVKDGVIDKMFIEPDLPGDPFQVSDADTMLGYINPTAALPKRVTVLSKPGCPHCTRAKSLLTAQGLKYEEIELGTKGISFSTLQAVSGRGTTPQVFIDGTLIGGADELEKWLIA